MRAIPPEVILSWPTPNYIDPETRGAALIIVNLIFVALAVTTVILRLYTRMFIKRWFGGDDFLIVLALIFTIGLTTVVLLANMRLGWDRHIYDIPLTSMAANLQVAMAAKLLFVAASTFTRLSILFFYYRLVNESHERMFRRLVHFNVALNVAMFIAFMGVGIFQCTPISNYWMFAPPKGSCVDEGKSTFSIGVINCVADIFCTILPISLVARLKLPLRQRIAVIILFGLGFIVSIAGMVRTWFIYKSLIEEYDQTWYAYPLWIAAAVEIDLGVICASAPVLRPLLARLPPMVSGALSSRTKKVSGAGTYGTTNGDEDLESAPQRIRTISHGRSTVDSNKTAVNPSQETSPFTRNRPQGIYQDPAVELADWSRKYHTRNHGASSSHSEQAICRVLSPIPPPPDSESLDGDDSPTVPTHWRL